MNDLAGDSHYFFERLDESIFEVLDLSKNVLDFFGKRNIEHRIL
jgi:hypothetical protein